MRLIIVRHGDPNYEIDSLTEKGWREAEFLSVRMEKQLQKEHTYLYITAWPCKGYSIPDIKEAWYDSN